MPFAVVVMLRTYEEGADKIADEDPIVKRRGVLAWTVAAAVALSAAVACGGTDPQEGFAARKLAPIEDVHLVANESFPVRYSLLVVSGLPNSCSEFDGYEVDREDGTIMVAISDSEPAADVAFAQLYGTAETRIPLDRDFETGETVNVLVNVPSKAFVVCRRCVWAELARTHAERGERWRACWNRGHRDRS